MRFKLLIYLLLMVRTERLELSHLCNHRRTWWHGQCRRLGATRTLRWGICGTGRNSRQPSRRFEGVAGIRAGCCTV